MSPFKFIIALTCAALCLLSCEKDDAPQQPTTGSKLVRIKSEFDQISFAYNADGSLKSAVYREPDNTLISKIDYLYNNGRITEGRTEELKIVYSYPEANLVRVSLKDDAGTTLYSFDYKLNGSKLVEVVQFSHGTGTAVPEERIVYTYNASGNISRTETFERHGGAWEKVDIVDVVQYDNKPNTTSSHETVVYYLGNISFLANNPTKEEHRSADGILYKTVTYIYTYDNKGRKTRAQVNSVETGMPEEREIIEYQYQ